METVLKYLLTPSTKTVAGDPDGSCMSCFGRYHKESRTLQGFLRWSLSPRGVAAPLSWKPSQGAACWSSCGLVLHGAPKGLSPLKT